MRQLIGWYGRAVDAIDRVLAAGMALLLGLVVLLTAAEILGRNVFRYSSPEAVDVTLSLAIVVYLVGYAVLLNRDQDVTMDFFYRRFAPAARRVIDLLTDTAILVFFVVLLMKSHRLFEMGLNSLHPVFPVPHGIVALPALAAGVACVLVALRRTLDSLLVLIDGTGGRGESGPGSGHIS
jgi:TRAP-type C4-dicarboxylate transport system permease small subunit